MAAVQYDEDVLELEYDIAEEDDEMPTIRHSMLQRRLLHILPNHLQNGNEAAPPITFQGFAQKYTPDVSIYAAEVLSTMYDSEETAPAPLLAIEIISPGQTIAMMIKKSEGMIASGVEECWIVEPANETVTVCTKERRYVRHEGELLKSRFFREALSVDAIFHDTVSHDTTRTNP